VIFTLKSSLTYDYNELCTQCYWICAMDHLHSIHTFPYETNGGNQYNYYEITNLMLALPKTIKTDLLTLQTTTWNYWVDVSEPLCVNQNEQSDISYVTDSKKWMSGI